MRALLPNLPKTPRRMVFLEKAKLVGQLRVYLVGRGSRLIGREKRIVALYALPSPQHRGAFLPFDRHNRNVTLFCHSGYLKVGLNRLVDECRELNSMDWLLVTL